MAKHTLQQAFDAGFVAVKEFLDEALAGFEARLARMESEFKYCGVWDASRQYEKSNFVIFAGSVWHANATTRSRPGDSADWTLAVKKGVDAR